MSLWVDRYRPKHFDNLDYHLDQAEYLKNLADRDDFPHLLLYGPSGAGKKTRLSCIISGLYGSAAEKIKLENLSFQTPSNKKIDINILSSAYHLELNPSDVGIYDRIVIQELIKNTAQTYQIDSASNKKFKVVVLVEAEKLSKDAQHALRRTMEKFAASCRIILIAESISTIIEPIQSRCLCIRIPSPTENEMINVMEKVCQKENLKLSQKLASRICKESGFNLRRALLMLETCRVHQYPFSDQQSIELPQWQLFIRQIALSIIEQQSSDRLLEVRGKFYELLSRCIPSDIIIRELLDNLLPHCDGCMKNESVQLAAKYESRIRKGSKAIFHLEAFVANFMAIQRRYLDEGLAELM